MSAKSWRNIVTACLNCITSCGCSRWSEKNSGLSLPPN
ncbi:hypothetical protein [Thalassolituus sp.]